MDDDRYNTMIIFANYLLGMNEHQTNISKSHANNTPFITIKTKNERKETIKEKQTSHPKARFEEQMILFENKIQRSVDL
jgi:hypothetical protein